LRPWWKRTAARETAAARRTKRIAGTVTSARHGLLHHGKSGRILSERWKTKETRMILRMKPEAKQGIQFQPAMGAANIRDGSQGSCTQS
jgi:hypothetical protein